MSESNNQVGAVLGATTTVGTVATLANTGVPVSIVLALGATIITLGLVVFLKFRQASK
jgi:LPXTG-motif cell wall-anchored protein